MGQHGETSFWHVAARTWFALVVCVMMATPVGGQERASQADPDRAERKLHLMEQRRLVRRFDFEEFEGQNFEAYPEDWYPIGRPPRSPDPNFMDHELHRQMAQEEGFPHYGVVRFDPPQTQSNVNHALHLGLSGGSAGAYLAVGAVAAVPSSDYLIQARVRTENLKGAYARMTAYFLNINGQVIGTSVREMPPLRTNGRWESISLKLWGEYPKAAWIGIRVEVRQPEADPDSPLGRHQLVVPQIEGGAWFDDIEVWQIPYVTVATQSGVNIIRAPRRPELRMNVRDVTGDRLESTVALYDHQGRVVARNHQRVGGGEPPSWAWTPPLERFGWYVLDMRVYDGQAPTGTGPERSPVARSVGAFLWLGPDALRQEGDAMRFGIDVEGLPERQMPLLAEMIQAAGVGSVIISAWDRDTNERNFVQREAVVGDVLRKLAGPGYQVTMSFHPLPAALEHRAAVYPNDVLSLFDRPWDMRAPYLAPYLTQYGQQVRRWKLGKTGEFEMMFNADLPRQVLAIERELSAITPSPTLVVPWRITESSRTDLPREIAYAIDVPPFVLPDQIPAYLEAWQEGSTDGAGVGIHLHTRSATQVTQSDRIAELMLRMLYAWKAQPRKVMIDRPWAASSDRQLTLLPDPLLGVFINTASRLSGRRVVGEMTFARGTRGLILDGPSGPALAAWNDRAGEEDAWIDIDLGGDPVAVDEWGNRAPVPVVEGRHRWPLGETPVFIENIDAPLARFRSSFVLDDPFVESLQVPHERVLSFTNTWPVAISGSFTILSPARWRFTPMRRNFSLRPGETMRVPLQLGFPISEIAGEHDLTARFDFAADKAYHVQLTTPMELGMRGVDFKSDLTYLPGTEPGTVDAVATVRVANVGNKPLLSYAFATLPGYPRQEKVLPRLEPGRSVVRSFRFENAGEALKGNRLRLGLREAEGIAVLNFAHEGRR